MTAHDAPDRISAWLEEEAAAHAPTGLHARFAEDLARTSQRPSWATPERWISMETRAQLGAVPRAAIILVTLGILVALAAGAIVAGSSSTPSLPPPFGAAANGLIAFSSNGDIHVAEPDGSDVRAITSGPAHDSEPHWSRDGRRLAYWSQTAVGGPLDLVIVNAEGQDAVTVATTESPVVAPFMTWSADGSEIAYSAVVPSLGTVPCPVATGDGGMCGSRIFIAATDGSGTRQVGDPDLDARSPELSPDGRTIAFGGGPAGSAALYTMGWDGSDVQRRTSEEIAGGGWGFIHQEWYQDGERIATQGGGYPYDIWRVDLETVGGDNNVSNDARDEIIARLAPSDEAISWSLEYEGTMVDDTSDRNDAHPIPTYIDLAIWSPDGELLAGANRAGDGLVIVARDGTVIGEVEAPGLDLPLNWQRLAP